MTQATGPHRATVRMRCQDAPTAQAVAGALALESAEGPPGATLSAEADGADVVLAASCPDLSGLRAALQGLVRLGDAARRSAESAAPRSGAAKVARD